MTWKKETFKKLNNIYEGDDFIEEAMKVRKKSTKKTSKKLNKIYEEDI